MDYNENVPTRDFLEDQADYYQILTSEMLGVQWILKLCKDHRDDGQEGDLVALATDEEGEPLLFGYKRTRNGVVQYNMAELDGVQLGAARTQQQ